MKKKLIRTITAMMLLGMAFTAGRQTGKTAWTDDYCTSPVTITDWNTNGVELSIALSDGSELTAYKSEKLNDPPKMVHRSTKKGGSGSSMGFVGATTDYECTKNPLHDFRRCYN